MTAARRQPRRASATSRGFHPRSCRPRVQCCCPTLHWRDVCAACPLDWSGLINRPPPNDPTHLLPAHSVMSETIELTQNLLARRSVTPSDEGCQQLMTQRLERAGFRVESLPFGNVENLWARRGHGGPLFCFAGHTDVVPTGPLEEWHSDPFAPTIRDGLLFGRGAADMKSGLAAMVTAAE